MNDQKGKLTLQEFAQSLFHGSRADNTFKFLHGQPEDKVDGFLQDLFRQVVAAVDSGKSHALGDFLQRAQVDGYAFPPDKPPFWGPSEPLKPVPLAPLKKPLAESTVALFSSAAVRLPDQPSFLPDGMDLATAMRDPMKAYERFPSLREIPADADSRRLVAEHIAYDRNAVEQDVNVMFPLDRMRELAEQGVFKQAPKAYSYMGLANLQRLCEQTAPEWGEKLAVDGVDAVVLVPG
ncbi:MAG: glycine/sarcosine/betaine reductase selenoprotein B family protein [Acidobacteriota bacterium]